MEDIPVKNTSQELFSIYSRSVVADKKWNCALEIKDDMGFVRMEKEVLEKYHMNCRNDAVRFLKSLWTETPQLCPLCNGRLDFLHKKAKKSNCDWICTNCGERYDTIKILNKLNET